MLTFLLAYLDEKTDKKMLEDIFHAYSKQMFLLAEFYLHNEHDAEDAVSTVFERIVLHNFDIVREIESAVDLRNYLLKATKNTALNMIGQKSKSNISLDSVTERDVCSVGKISDESLLDYICTKAEYEEVIRAILSLKEKYRDALHYHFVLEKTVSETAKLMFQSVAATKQQLVRGKKMLIAILGQKGGESNGNDKG